jgi:hypothetical protein
VNIVVAVRMMEEQVDVKFKKKTITLQSATVVYVM